MDEQATSDTRTVSLAAGRLVGRGAELARILSALDAIASGNGRTVLLFGEPGVGKTRLANEVLVRARERGAQVRVGRAFQEHTAVPYFPFTEALTFTMKEGRLLPPDEVLNRWPELVRLLVDAGTKQSKPDGQASQLPVFRAVTAFFHALAEASPLVLLLDDLHWADSTSLSLLLYLCRHLDGARVLVLCTYRDLELESGQTPAEIGRELVRDRLADEVHVGRLAVHETAALIRARLHGASVSNELVALVHDRAEGNPFFTEELLKALVERGFVSQVRGRWETRVSDKIDVPRSVRWVVGQRVKRLASGAQELLRLASVMGEEFELYVLLGACGLPEVDVLDHLDDALRAGLLEKLGDRSVERYRFAHALIQQTLYDELPSYRRRQLHRRVGEALEATAGRSVLPARLARHFLAAGDDERAVRYAIEAGDQAATQYAHAEAAHHYQVALDRLLEQRDELHAADVRYRLAQELFDLNRLADALSAYQAALDSFERLGDITAQMRVHRGIGLLHHGQYDMVAAVPHLDAALRLWPAGQEDAELAWLLLDASRVKFLVGDFAAAIPLAERCLALAERCDDTGLLTRALTRVSMTRMRQDPRPFAAIALLDRAERIGRWKNDWRALNRVYLTRADEYELAGELEHSLADRRRAVEAAQRCGEIERQVFAYHTTAETCLRMGAWRAGRDAARAGLALDLHGLLKALPGAADLTWMDGRAHEAFGQLRRYIADARGRGDMQGVSIGLTNLTEWALQLDMPADVEASAREAAELQRLDGGWMPWPGYGCGPLVETLVRLDASDADSQLGAAEQMVAASEQYATRPQVLRARGLLLHRQGDLDGALVALAASADAARSQHARIQLGRTLDIQADVARQRGNVVLAGAAEAELARVVDSIGPEVITLAWARRVRATVASTAASPAVGSANKALRMLTRREREVARLVARGLTNRQIASALVIAEGTAGVHVDHILSKLGFRSRAQVAAWAVEHGLPATPTD